MLTGDSRLSDLEVSRDSRLPLEFAFPFDSSRAPLKFHCSGVLTDGLVLNFKRQHNLRLNRLEVGASVFPSRGLVVDELDVLRAASHFAISSVVYQIPNPW